MPPKKSAPKNAFYYFMEEFREREEARGRFYDTMAEVATAAGPEWQEMSADDRKPYELMKEENKAKKKEKKYTSLGEDVEAVKKREEDEEREKKLMIKNIEDVVSDGNDYVHKSFFVAQVNHYCYCNAQNRHIPAEISIVRFSLQDGVDLEDCYHVILDTGNMPIGYRLAAVTVSEESHLIPVPPHEGEVEHISEKDMRKAYLSMAEFVRRNLGSRERLPPIYVDDSNMEMAKDIFRNLYEQYSGDNVYNEMTVYSLSYLFFVLRNAAHSSVAGNRAFPFPTIPQSELEKDIYDYVKGIACEYHNMTDDAYPHCTLSKCIRKIFIICDHTCYDLEINLIPGRHIPRNSKSQRLEQRPSSQLSNAWSTVSNNNSRPSSSLSNGVRSYASTATNSVQAIAKQTANLSLNKQNKSAATAAAALPAPVAAASSSASVAAAASSASAAAAASSASAAAAARPVPVRKPQTISVARSFRPMQVPDLNNDFPALGSPRPQSVGRGRGRILQQMLNK